MTTIDICQRKHRGADTSAKAHERSKRKAPTDRANIYCEIRLAGKGGLTCAEIETRLALSHQSASARISELSRRGMIRDTKRRRPTSSGCMARVYVTAETQTTMEFEG